MLTPEPGSTHSGLAGADRSQFTCDQREENRHAPLHPPPLHPPPQHSLTVRGHQEGPLQIRLAQPPRPLRHGRGLGDPQPELSRGNKGSPHSSFLDRENRK